MKEPRVTWEHALAAVIAGNPIIKAYGFPGPAEVPELKRRGGNPYLDFWRQVDGNSGRIFEPEAIPPAFTDFEKLKAAMPGFSLDFYKSDPHGMLASLARYMCRTYATNLYAWAIPDEAALDAIAGLGQPIHEIGSGRGYWAWMLERRGVRIVTEEKPRAGYEWFWRRPDRRSGPGVLPKDHALFLCWPDYDAPWAYHRLRTYRGSTVVYVGEWEGCTADDKFHEELEKRFTKTASVPIPQWDGLHDALYIYER